MPRQSLWQPVLMSAGNVSGGWLSALGVFIILLWGFYKFFHISSLRNRHQEVVAIKETAVDALAFGVMFGLFAADRRSQGQLSVLVIVVVVVVWIAIIAASYLWYTSKRIAWEDSLRDRKDDARR